MLEKTINSPNLAKLLNKTHADKWVAFSINYNKVVAFSDSLELLMREVGDKDVVVMKTLPEGVSYAPTFLTLR